MGVKDGFMGASVMVKVSFIILVIANVLNWIAFCTASWGYIKGGTNPGFGIWRSCGETTGGCAELDGTRLEYYAAFQAFGIFGFVGVNLAMLVLSLFMFGGPCKSNGEAKMAVLIICFVAAVCWIIAVIIFGAKWDDNNSGNPFAELGFSFALAIVTLILAVIAGILLIVDGKGGGGTSPA